MRLTFILVAGLIVSCGKIYEDGIQCSGVNRNAGNVHPGIEENSLVLAVGNYARLKYIYDHQIPPQLAENLDSTKEATINKFGITLRNKYAITLDDLKSYPGEIGKKNWIGVCCRGNNKIIIDRTFWNGTVQDQKNLLIMHELGHCNIDRAHTPEGVKSIMHPSIITPSVYNPNYLNKEASPSPEKYKYDHELFSKIQFN